MRKKKTTKHILRKMAYKRLEEKTGTERERGLWSLPLTPVMAHLKTFIRSDKILFRAFDFVAVPAGSLAE